ncbi:MAG: MYXO-CTERM sorting domain-containing protein [Myxococcota bacterium]
MTSLRKLLLGVLVGATEAWAISLPFSTTYDCAEQQAYTPSLSCDGLSWYGAWTTQAGANEQVTSAANYPDGGGGRGQRHWIGNGLNQNSGSILYDFPATNEVYVRWYVRWQPGLATTSGSSGQKVLYFAGNGCGNGGGCYFDIQGAALRTVVAGRPYTTTTYGWNALNGGVNSSTGAWSCFEIHVKSETAPDAGNGVAQWWIDGTLRHDHRTVSFGNSATGFNFFILPENANVVTVSGQDMYNDIDDVIVQTTGPIGCIVAGDAGTPTDAGAEVDAGLPDGGRDEDAGGGAVVDAGQPDAGHDDVGPNGCGCGGTSSGPSMLVFAVMAASAQRWRRRRFPKPAQPPRPL